MANREERERRRMDRWERRKHRVEVGASLRGNIWVGLLFVAIGCILMAKQVGVFFPHWLFTWPVLVIVFGIFIGAKSGFRDFGWVIFTGVGIVFLLDRMYPDMPIHQFIWPVAIIGLGLMIVIAPRRRHKWWDEHHDGNKGIQAGLPASPDHPELPNNPQPSQTPEQPQLKYDGEDMIDSVAIFGGVDKSVFSKNFKGGQIICIFGGGEINLAQADFEKTATLEIVAIFGGVKLTVPSHWSVRAELNPMFGGIDDKRAPTTNPDPNKVLIIKGAVVFGGVDIRSY